MSGLIWKINRLRTMSVPEVVYRFKQLLHTQLQRRGHGLAKNPPKAALAEGKPFFSPDRENIDAQRYTEAADRILSGNFTVFAIEGAHLGFPPKWNTDCKTGVTSPLVFGKTLEYRDERIVGDIKYLWEPARHLEVSTLAQAWYVSGRQQYLDGVRTLIESWIDQCPYPNGPHWTSSLEHSVRLLNWSFTWHLIGGLQSDLFRDASGKQFRDKWLASIYQHLHFIGGHFSLHSSANNHLLGEYMGLLIGSVTWPMWKECEKWKKIGRNGFVEQALLQNHVDGVNKEQAIYYQHEVMDMMLICGMLCKSNNIDLPNEYWARFDRLSEFLYALMDIDGNVPMFGDSDDAVMIRFDPQCENVYTPLLNAAAIILDKSQYRKTAELDQKCIWFFGGDERRSFPTSRPASLVPPTLAFPYGGYYLLGSDFGTPSEVRAVIDCAPLGYLSIAAHGHADALSMVLSVSGKEILVDPGTYAYHTQKQWRDYFRSTAAHNTLQVDGVDQSVIGGNFMWLSRAESKLLHYDSAGRRQVFEGQHDGYSRLGGRPLHRRVVEYDSDATVFTVRDFVTSSVEHNAEVNWHLSETCEVALEDGGVSITNGHVEIAVRCLTPGWTVDVLYGCENPLRGWISRRFDRKRATNTIRFSGRIGREPVVTEIAILSGVNL